MATGVVGIAILLVLFVGAMNLVLDEYAKGAVRTAVDEGAQDGAGYGGSVAACEAGAARARAALLPGPFGRAVRIDCHVEGDEMVASASGELTSLFPGAPAVAVSVAGVSVIEQAPGQ